MLVLFACSSCFTSRWTVFEADGLRDNPPTSARCSRSSGSSAARSAPPTARCWRRTATRPGRRLHAALPAGALFAHAVGYAFTSHRARRLEQSLQRRADRARATSSSTLFDELLGPPARATTCAPRSTREAQQVAIDGARRGRKGAVVALDAKTGAVKVMARPALRPERLDDPARSARLNRDEHAPLVNRATQARYPPGSTFKVVTAAAALDSRQLHAGLARRAASNGKIDLGRRRWTTSAARTSGRST